MREVFCAWRASPSTGRCSSTATTTLTAICKLKDDAPHARFSAAAKAVSVTDLPLPLCKPLALAVVLKTALSCTSEAP
jgi:hypothetical protein